MAQGAHTTKISPSASDSSSADEKVRQARIVQAMHVIRRALSETSKIQLGSKFKFLLHFDEEGQWPNIELRLVRKENFETTPYILEVKANDQISSGLISISLKSGPIFGEVHITRADDFKKIPAILKSAVKEYLDLIKEYVLTQKYSSEEDMKPAESVTKEQPRLRAHPPKARTSYHSSENMLSDEDMYLDDLEYDNVIEEDSTSQEPLAIEM